MSIVYRKTAKGQSEIETRAHRLVPRLRSTLILVDGRKTDEELARLVQGEPAAALISLLADGFIEVVSAPADKPPEPPLEPAARTAAAPVPPPAVPAPPRKEVSVQSLRRDAVHFLNEHMGPAADGVAMKLERAKTMAELRPMLVSAAQLLASFHGADTARDFAARFLSDEGG